MKDILVTSSVLILVLLVLRQVFRRTISRRVQYALWGLVLLRLLAPVSLPALEHNVLTAVEPVSRQLTAPALYIEPVREQVSAPADVPDLDRHPSEYRHVVLDRASAENTRTFTDQRQVTHTVEYARQVPLTEPLRYLWYAGMTVTGGFFLFSNLRFWRKLRKVRKPYSIENCKHPVYLVADDLPSPCLFGLFRPAIYLTPAATVSPEVLGHVITHESTHARHLDPLWSALRGVCLTVYWFDPLVWTAAIVSRRDCELACDEGALKRLGEDQRIPYGRTLLSLVPVRRDPAGPLLTATTMTAGKRQLKDRVTRIAENRQTVAAALFLALALIAALCAATFTGAKAPAGPDGSGPRMDVESGQFQLENTIPLVDAEPWAAEDADITDIPAADVTWVLDSLDLPDGKVVGCGTLTDGRTAYYYADSETAETLHMFFSCPTPSYGYSHWVAPFQNVLGQSGFTIHYESDGEGQPYEDGANGRYDALGYYFFDEHDVLRRLAFAPTNVTERPCDTSALLAVTWGDIGSLLYFQQDGQIYRVELNSVLSHAYPEWQMADVGYYDDLDLLGVNGYLAVNGALARRYMDFDGENLLVYKDCRPLTDHVLGEPKVPDAVLDTAKTVVESLYQEQPGDIQPEGYDDWRIQQLEHCYTYDPAEGTGFHGMKIAVYQLNYEFHTQTPLDQVFLAGGMYVTEDNWVMPSYPNCTYLLFREENGQLTYLYSVMSNDTFPGRTLFTQDMEMQMLEDGTLTVAGMSHKELSELFYLDPEVAIRRLSTSYDEEQDLGCRALARTIQERQDPTLFARLNAIGLTGREAQTLDLLRYHCGDLGYGTLPKEILDFYINVSAAYRSGIHQAARYIHFYNDMHREMFLSNGDRSLDLTLEYGRKINDGLYALVVRAEYADGLKNDTPHSYCFVGRVDGQWQWITNVDFVPEALRKDLDTERYDYFSPNILGSVADVETEQPTEEEPAAAQAPKAPTEADLHSAILNFRKAQTANRNYDFSTEAHHILDETSEGDTHTYYMMVGYYTYKLTDGTWASETGGGFPAAATFTREDGGWVLTDYFEPSGGGRYEPDIRANFSQTAADALFSGENDIWWSDLQNQCDDAAVRYFARTTGQVPAKQFTEADVEFQDQPLSLEADSMSYEERLQWIEESREYTGTQDVIVSDSITQNGAVAYAAYWVGTPHMDQNFLTLRLPDGRQSYLPLPCSYMFGIAAPDTMAFDGSRFLYTVTFQDEMLMNEGQSLLHLKGTYRYTVDMTAGTVSLDVDTAE